MSVPPGLSVEHDPAGDGYCAACGYDWPCPTAKPERWTDLGEDVYGCEVRRPAAPSLGA